MFCRTGRPERPRVLFGVVPSCVLLVLPLLVALQARAESARPAFPFRDGDRVAWIGSSSTKIGVWPKTMEFLLHTRHPELNLQAQRFTTGGGTFATGLAHLDEWLAEFKPTLVFFNYGGNDASAGEAGIPKFLENMEKCVARVQESGARVVLVTPQAADVRKSGEEPAAKRQKYTEVMIEHCRAKGWSVIDTHHPLAAMQAAGEKEDPAYSMLKDKIHLTNPAYVGWGYILYDLLDPDAAESAATLEADGRVVSTKRCEILDVKAGPGVLSFTRADKVLPILPPGSLPPRQAVPLEARSRYLLRVEGLPEGSYAITSEGEPVGTADAKTLAAGINLNTLLLNQKQTPPWEALAKQIWDGQELDQVGKTRWRFEIRKQ